MLSRESSEEKEQTEITSVHNVGVMEVSYSSCG